MSLNLTLNPHAQAGQRRQSIILLRWLTIIATSYAVLFSSDASRLPTIAPALLVFILSNVALRFVPERRLTQTGMLVAIVLFDSVMTSLALMLTPQIEHNIIVLYFFVILIAAMGSTLSVMVLVSSIISGLYLLALWQAEGSQYVLQSSILLRVPFLFCATLFYGYLSATARQDGDELFRAVFESSLDGITVSDWETGATLEVNEEFLKLAGFRRGQVLGRTPVDLGLWADPGFHRQVVEQVHRDGVVRNVEGQLQAEDGRTVFALVSLVRGNWSGRACVFSFIRDVTERKQLEEQLVRAQKMDAIGRLAGGVAHDFNNLLTIILGATSLLRPALPEGEEARSDLEAIDEAATRAADLTNQLLAFGRRGRHEPRVIEMNEMVANTQRMLRRMIGEDIELVSTLAEGLGRVRLDPTQFEQVLVNLAVNAREAMPEGGRLSIDTANVRFDGAQARERALPPGPYVRLRVSDTGVGMTAEVKSRIFEPFFTTRAGKGTGLGLATCYGIVTQSGGAISVDSQPGRGTTFSIFFPLVEAAAPLAAADRAAEEDLCGGTETVLVVEDEIVVRRMATRILRSRGYSVLEASSGDEAIEMFRAGDLRPVDLMLSDVVLPGRRGTEVGKWIHEKYPQVRVLLMSGYADDVALGRDDEGTGAFLQKPFTRASLLRKVREMLDQPATS